MKKSKIVVRSVFLCLLAAIVLFFSFGISNFSYAEKETSFKEENLALKAELKTGKGEKTVKNIKDENYKTAWSPKDRQAGVILSFDEKITFNTFVLREDGWNIKDFDVYYSLGKNSAGEEEWKRFYRGDKIEDFRLCAFENITTDKIKLMVNESNARFKINEIEIYNVEPVDQSFTSCGYISTKRCVEYMNKEPGDRGYVSSKLFNSIKRLTIAGQTGLNMDTGYMYKKNIPGTNMTYFDKTYDFIKEKIGENDVEIFLSGLWRYGPALDEPLRSIAIKNIVDFLVEYDLDGFDIDWEFPKNEEEFRKLNEFIIELDKAFEPYDKKISTAWYAWDVSLSKEAIDAIDYLNVMAYDEFDQDGNICSFMSGAVQPIQYFIDMGFESEKIYLGLPLYTRKYTGGKAIEKKLSDEGIEISRFNGECDGFLFNSPQLIADKTAYAIEEGLGGVFVWVIPGDAQLNSESCISDTIDTVVKHRINSESEAEN